MEQVGARLRVSRTVPHEVVASHGGGVAGCCLVHGQVENHNTVASPLTVDGVSVLMKPHPGSYDLEAIGRIIRPLANLVGNIRDSIVGHRQMQDDRAVAAMNCVPVLVIIASLGNIETILVIDTTFAYLSRKHRNGSLMQRKDQNGGVLTGIRIIAIMDIST